MSGLLVGKRREWSSALFAAGAAALMLGIAVWGIKNSHAAERLVAGGLLFPVIMMAVRWNNSFVVSLQPSSGALSVPGRDGTLAGGEVDRSPDLQPSLEATLDAILSGIRQLVAYDVAEITLWDEERQCCVTQGWGGDRAYARRAGGVYHIDEGYTGWIIRYRRVLLVRDVQARRDVRPKLDTPEYPFQSYIGIPLQIRGHFVGTLELASYQIDAWSEREIEILHAVANQAVVAIENAHLYAETQRISAAVSESLELDHVLRTIASAVLEVVGCQRSAIFVLDEARRVLQLAMTQGLSEEYAAQSQVLTLEHGGRAHAVVTEEPLIVSDVQADESLLAFAPMSIREGFRAFADLPLKRADRVIGMLSAMFVEPHRFSEIEVELLSALAHQAAVAIENARLYGQADEELRRREEALRRRHRELSTLYEAATTTSSSLSLDAVLQTVADQMTKALNSKGCALSLWDPERNVVETLVDYSTTWAEPSGTTYALDDYPATRLVLEARQPVVVQRDDPTADGAELALMREQGIQTLLMLPLIARDQVLGLAELIDDTEARDYTTEEIRLAESLAAQAAIAIENARLYEQAQQEIGERARAGEAMRRLQRVSREINATLDLGHILNLVLEEAIRQSKATHGAIVLRDSASGELQLEVCTGYSEAEEARIRTLLRAPQGRSALAEVLRSNDSLLIPNVVAGGDKVSVRSETRSMLTVPIFYLGTLAGLIVLESTVGGAFDQGVLEFAEGLSAQAATAIGNAQRYQEQLERGELLRRRADRLAAVLEVSRALRSDRPLEQILEEIAYAIQESVGFNLVVIGVLEGEPPYRRRVAAAGVPIAEFERLKKIREPWSVVADLMVEEYRISRSYYIPAEQQARWRGRIDVYEEQVKDTAREPGRWHPQDLLLVPLVGPGGDVQGLLSADQPLNGRVPDLETVEALEIFAAQAALAIENARLMDALERRAEALALFNEVGRAATAHLQTVELSDVLNTVVEMMPRLLEGDHSSIFLLDAESEQYVPRAACGLAFEEISSLGFALGDGLVGAVAESGMPLSIDDVKNDPRSIAGFLGPDTGSVVLSPLTVGRQVVGVLSVGRCEPRAFSPAEVATLSVLADQVAVAVENARLFDEVRRFSQEMERRVEERTRELADAMGELTEERDRVEILYRITSRLSASLDLDHVLNLALGLVVDAVGAERASILMMDSESGRLIYRAALGAGDRLPIGGVPTRFSPGEGLAGWVVEHREAVIVPDIRHDPRWLESRSSDDREYRSALAVPLVVSDEVLGVLLLFHLEIGHFNEDHLRLVETAAIQVANAINNAELYRLIFDQAERLGNTLKAQKVEATKSQAILEGVADGVIVADADGKIILFNAAAERILELSREKALGRSINEMLGLYGSEARHWMERVVGWADRPQTYAAGEYLAARLEIGDRIVSVHLAPVLMENEFLGTVSAFRDVTAEVEAERAKTEFVSTVSHELRTPITSIKGYVDLLLMGAVGAVTQDQHDFLSVVRANVDRLTVLVNDLLDISRIESGRLAISPQVMHVEEVINQILEAMRGRAVDRGLNLRSEVTSPLPKIVADPDRVAQILTNLMGNACNYTPAGGDITVSAYAHSDEVRVSISDTGIGISKGDQEKIFERFFRADDSLVQDAPGAGLGLSIVQSLTEMQGGRVWVESELGCGSVFTVAFPAAKSGQVVEQGLEESPSESEEVCPA